MGTREILAIGAVLVAATAVGLASLRADPADPPVPQRGFSTDLAHRQDLRDTRQELALVRSENAALRSELDRLLGRIREGDCREPRNVPPPASGDPHDAQLPADPGVVDAIRDMASVGTGDAHDAAIEIVRMLPAGSAGSAALRDAYRETADPGARGVILGAMLFGRGTYAAGFAVEELGHETDPALRERLATHASRSATPERIASSRERFVEILEGDDPAPTREAAVRGLRYARDDASSRALLHAATDPDERVRLAAIEMLALRSDNLTGLRKVIDEEPSSRVREIGECRLLLAEEGE